MKSSAAEPSHCVAAPLSNHARTMPAASTAGLSTAARPICSGFYPVATMLQRRKLTQRRQARSLVPACHLLYEGVRVALNRVAAPLSNQARTMPAASTAGLSTAIQHTRSRLYLVASVASLAQRAKRQAHTKAVGSEYSHGEKLLQLQHALPSPVSFTTVSLSFIRQRGYWIESAADGPCCRAQASGKGDGHRCGLIAQRSCNMMGGLRGRAPHRP